MRPALILVHGRGRGAGEQRDRRGAGAARAADPLEVDRRRRRAPDDLDALIDELLPDVGDGPGWTDGLFVVSGIAVTGWSIAASGPGWSVVVGVVAITLGCVLPARALWRRAADRRRMRALARIESRGTRLDATEPETARLVGAYRELLHALPGADPDVSGLALAAAHTAVVEVATLDGGRARTQAEAAYITRRADAVAALASSLANDASGCGGDGNDDAVSDPPVGVVEARDELDLLTGTSSVDRLLELAYRGAPRHGDG